MTISSPAKASTFIQPAGINAMSWTFVAPDDWKRKRLKYLCAINPSRQERRHLTDDDPVTFLPMELASEGVPSFQGTTRPLGEVIAGFTRFQEGDVLVAKITPCFENGKGGICRDLVNGVGFGSTEFHVLRPGPEVLASFVYYALLSRPFRFVGKNHLQGAAGQQRVPSEFISEFVLPYPDLRVQEAIVDFIESHDQCVDGLYQRCQILFGESPRSKGSGLIQEFRATLIAEAITGRIDVNGNA